MLNANFSKLLKAIKNVSNAKNILRNRTILSLSAVFAINFIIFIMTGILYFRNEVYIIDGENDYRIFTMSDEAEDIISEQGIELNELDFYDFSGFNNDTAYLNIRRAVNVSVTVNGVTEIHSARAGDTTEDILNRAKIKTTKFDVIKPELSAVCGNGDSIEIIPAINISITADGETVTLPVRADSTETVADVLSRAGIKVLANDIVSEPLEKNVIENITEVKINRVNYVDKVTINAIPFETFESKSTLYPIGHTEIVVTGMEGSEEIITREMYIDGELISTETISEKITAEPVNEIIVQGTALATPYSKREFEEIILSDGLPVNYDYIVSGKSYAYTAREGSGTASGRKLQIGTIAVIPSEIPYGSLLYIVTQDGKTVYGAAVAADTGYLTDAVADLYMGLTSEHYDDACNWGARYVDIYVISVGTY